MSPAHAAALRSTVGGPVQSRLAAAYWMIFAALMWTIVGISVRYLEGRVPITDLSFYRALVSIVVMAPLVFRISVRGGEMARHRAPIYMFILRGIFIFTAQSMFYFALTYMPMAEATVLNTTTPIFIAIFAWLFLKEKIARLRWVAILMGFIGVLVILRPGFIPLDIFGLAALVSAVLFAASSVINRFLSRTEPASRVVLYTNVLIAICGSIPFFIYLVTPSWADMTLVLSVAVTGTMAQYCLARAMAAGEASFVGPFEFLRVPLAAVAGLVVFSEFPNEWAWAGTGVVFIAILLLTQSHRRSSNRSVVTPTET